MTLRRAAIAISAAALMVVAGCDSDSDDTSSDESSSESTEPTGDPTGDPTADPTVEPTVEPAAGLTLANFPSTTSGAQVQAESTHLEVEVEAQGQSITLSGDMALGESLEDNGFAVDMSAPELGGEVSMILVDGVLYLNAGEMTRGKYVAMNLDDPSNPMGAFYTQLFGQSDPAAITRAFEGAIEDFRPVGSEEIDGTATTKYRVTVDTRKVLAKTLGQDLLAAQSSLGRLPKTLTYDIWVGDHDNLPRRMRYAVMGSTVVMELTNWGEPVDIQAPPESEISDRNPFARLQPAPSP